MSDTTYEPRGPVQIYDDQRNLLAVSDNDGNFTPPFHVVKSDIYWIRTPANEQRLILKAGIRITNAKGWPVAHDQLGFNAAPTYEYALLRDYPLYGGTPPHVEGSDTSAAAAEQAHPNVGRMQARILEAIRWAADGMTCDDLEALTGYPHQSCSARVRELVLLGRIYDTGDRRKTRLQRLARIYKLT